MRLIPTTPAVAPDGKSMVRSDPGESARRAVLHFVLVAALTAALLTPPALLITRPPSAPQLTLIGTASGNNEGALSVLLEGAGGGRILIGGGSSGADLPAALARAAPPWRDLLLVADARDLPGATELVRRGRVRQVATVGLTNDREPALVALRERCAADGVPLRAVGMGERIVVGRGGALSLDVRPGSAGAAPLLMLNAGALRAAIVVGTETAAESPALAIVPHGSMERYRAALAGGPRLLVAPTAPTGGAPVTATQLLLVAPGQQSTLTVAGAKLRLYGGTPIALLPDTGR